MKKEKRKSVWEYINCIEILKEYKEEVAAHNLNLLRNISVIGTILGSVLFLLSLPFIGVLKLTLSYFVLMVYFMTMLVLTKIVLPKRPSYVLFVYYLFMILLLSLAIYMGTAKGVTTNATTFFLCILLIPLFIIDRPWKLILVNLLMSIEFIYFACQYKKPGDILSLDISNAIVFFCISVFFIVMTVNRQMHIFEMQRKVDEELKQKDHLINAIPAGIGIFEVHGKQITQVFMNEGYYRLMEDTREHREEMTQGNFMNGIHPEDRFKVTQAIQSVIDGKNSIALDCRSMQGDGNYIWIRFASLVELRKGDFIRVYSTYANMEEEMKSKQQTRAKTEFLSRMSHDIRTPMNAIMGVTKLAKEEKDIEVVKEYLNNIDSSSNFLLGLINDILDLSKIESGEFILKPEPYSEGEFKESIQTIIGPLMAQKELDFIVDVNLEAEYILVDQLRLNQIFFNLLSNAAKFTPANGKVEFIAKKWKDEKSNRMTRFIIRDNGIGMSEEFQKELFIPFHQERSFEGDFSSGTGLGLPIVKSLIDAMNGKIAIKSEINHGTEYIVDLYTPVVKKREEASMDILSIDTLIDTAILLVEDNDMNILVAQKLLESKGCRIFIAQNGQEAVDMFESSEENFYDAILMDIRMPVMDGLKAAKTIRSLERNDAKTIPIIAMTADAFTEEQKRTFDAGMNAHLSKPVNPLELYQTLMEQIKSKE